MDQVAFQKNGHPRRPQDPRGRRGDAHLEGERDLIKKHPGNRDHEDQEPQRKAHGPKGAPPPRQHQGPRRREEKRKKDRAQKRPLHPGPVEKDTGQQKPRPEHGFPPPERSIRSLAHQARQPETTGMRNPWLFRG